MMQNAKKKWTIEDEEFLLESYGVASMKHLVGRLRRSEEAIQQKYKEITGTKDLNMAGGLLSPRQIAPALGVDHRTIVDWIQHHNLKAKQLNRRSKYDSRHFRYYVDPIDLWKWIARHKEKINFSHVKQGELLPEPKWLEEEIRKSSYMKRPTSWTKAEDEVAFSWWQSGVNYREIAKRLNRPEKGTQRRLTYLRKKKGVTHAKTK